MKSTYVETIEQEKFLKNMPKALDDRIVQQVGHYHRLFAARQIMTKSRHMIDIVVQVPNLARAIAAEHLLQVTSQPYHLGSYKLLILNFLCSNQRSSKAKLFYNSYHIIFMFD